MYLVVYVNSISFYQFNFCKERGHVPSYVRLYHYVSFGIPLFLPWTLLLLFCIDIFTSKVGTTFLTCRASPVSSWTNAPCSLWKTFMMAYAEFDFCSLLAFFFLESEREVCIYRLQERERERRHHQLPCLHLGLQRTKSSTWSLLPAVSPLSIVFYHFFFACRCLFTSHCSAFGSVMASRGGLMV